MREERLEAKSRANWRYDRGAACCNNMPCASNRPSRTCSLLPCPSMVRIGSYSLAIGLSPRTLVFCRPHSITLADYSALSTCKRAHIGELLRCRSVASLASSFSCSRGATYGDRRRTPRPILSRVKLAPTRTSLEVLASVSRVNKRRVRVFEITRRILAPASVNVGQAEQDE